MKGHLRERSPGHWAIILDIPDPKTGNRRRKWHSSKERNVRRGSRAPV
jgi:hypothetical protein